MKLSIITVCYNSAKTITAAIESVLRQVNCDVEYIIIDGGSTDNTASIVKSYSSEISHFISEPDEGIYDAMNKGLTYATGDVVGFLNSDDIYANNRVLEQVINTFQTRNCDAVYGDLLYVDQNNTNRVIRTWISGPYNKAAFLFGWMPPHPTFFVTRNVYVKHGTFNTSLHNAADYEIMLRFLYKTGIKVAYIPQVLVKMRQGGLSNSSWKSRIKANREDRLAWKINQIEPTPLTLWLKPVRKIPQFIARFFNLG